jgi:hypothetical protein
MIPLLGSEYDFKTLHAHLINLKIEHPHRFSADVEFKNRQQSAVDYEKIVTAIDSIRHLSDEEYGVLRVAQKKVRNLELNDAEKEKIVPDEIAKLAQSLMQNEVTQNTDQKLLFPDVALVGLD